MNLPAPHRVANAFVDAIREGSTAFAWQLLEPSYRMTLVRRWVDQHPQLAALDLDQERDNILRATGAWSDFPALCRNHLLLLLPPATERWGWATRPRPVEPGLEKVLFANVDAVNQGFARLPAEADTVVARAITFYMRADGDSWSIASIDEPDEF